MQEQQVGVRYYNAYQSRKGVLTTCAHSKNTSSEREEEEKEEEEGTAWPSQRQLVEAQ